MAMYRLSLKHHKHSPTKATAAQQAAYIMRDMETPETKAYVEYVLRQSRKTQGRCRRGVDVLSSLSVSAAQ